MATQIDATTIDAKASSTRGPEFQDAETTQEAAPKQADATNVPRSTSGCSNDDQLEDGEEVDPEPEQATQPPLPVGEEPPPLPNEAPPDDGWDALWDESAQVFYFYNRITGVTQWHNPRLPETDIAPAPGLEEATVSSTAQVQGGYNPAIHGDYDPNADYAIEARQREQAAVERMNAQAQGVQPQAPDYAATGTFNRFTGRWQAADQNPERHSDDAKSKRQMNAFFDVDTAANSHGGKSLKAERQSKKLSKAELKAFKEKRRGKKEEKRRAWLLD